MIALLAVCIFVYFCCRVQTVEVEGSTLYTQQQIQDYVLDGTYSYNSVYAVADNLIHPKENIPFGKSVKVRMTGFERAQDYRHGKEDDRICDAGGWHLRLL